MKTLLVGVLLLLTSACSTINTGSVNYGSIDEKFNVICQNTPMLVDFLDDFPKGADLHNHASGAAYIEYGIIYAHQKGFFYDLEKLEIVKEDTTKKETTFTPYSANSPQKKVGFGGWMKGRPHLIAVKDLLTNDEQLQEYLDVVSARGWHENTINGLDHFFNAFSHKVSENKAQSLARILARNYSQGVRYVELMTSAISWDVIVDLQKLVPEESFDITNLEESYAKISSYLDSPEFKYEIVSYMDKREKAVAAILEEQYNLTLTGDKPDVVVRYIPQLYRMQSLHSIFISAAANLKASMLDERIVATNMVQAESSIPAMINFTKQMKILDFFWNKLGEPKIALHAGELVLRESPLEPMRDRISKSITMGHASRIGHGISIAWEEDTEKTLKMMRDKGVAVEICLSSNDMILGVSGKDHPLSMYMQAGVPVSISTDDEGISRSNLTMEYVRAVQEHGLSYEKLKQIAKNGLQYSFLDGDGIYSVDGTVKKEYRRFLLNEFPGLAEVGTKAYLQIRHERDLASFERKVL